MAKAKKNNELRIVRAFSAPVKLVWEAFTDVNHQQHWWGPRGFTITTQSKDLKVGGKWIYTMHGPDGVDYPNITTYHVVEKYSKLVYDHGANEEQGPLFRVTVTFEEFKGKTVMDMTMALETEEAAKEIEKFIKKASGNSTWDRLGEYLEKEQNKKDVFIINRSFKSEINTMFELWTNPEHFSKWMGPVGSQMKFLETDVRVGGKSHYIMTIGDEVKFYVLLTYHKISSPNGFVYSQSFSDENKNICKPPFEGEWPEKMLNTVSFVDEGDGHTRVTVQIEVEGEVTELEYKTFRELKASMTTGWSETFDKLEELLNNSN